MHLTVQHTRLFRMAYIHPQQCYILCCIFISIKHRIAVVTSKLFALPIAYMHTIMTSLTRISRWHIYQFNTIKQTLVSKKTSKLIEVPFTYSCSKFLALLIGRKSNTFQILNGNSFAFGFCKLNNLFAYCVIDNCTRSSFFARQSFQDFFRAFRTFALKRTPYFLSFFSIIIKFFRIEFCSITKCCDFNQSHINSDKLLHIYDIFLRNINGLKQVKLTFLKYQICFAFNVRQVVLVMANKVNLLPTTNTPQRNYIIGLVGHYPAIIGNTPKRSKFSFSFLIQLIGISNFCYTSYQYLRGKLECSFVRMVNFVMEFKIIKILLFPSHIRNGITNSINFLHRIEKQVNLFISRQKFYFQSEFHLLLNMYKNTKNFLHRKIILNLFNFKGVSVSLTSHPHYVMNGFHAPRL